MAYPTFSEDDFAELAKCSGISFENPWHRARLVDVCWDYLCYASDFDRCLSRDVVKKDLERRERNIAGVLRDLRDFSATFTKERAQSYSACRLVQVVASSDPCTKYDSSLIIDIAQVERKLSKLASIIKKAKSRAKGRRPDKIYHFFYNMAAVFKILGGNVAVNNSPNNKTKSYLPSNPFVKFVCWIAHHLKIINSDELENLPYRLQYWKQEYYDRGRPASVLTR